MGLTRESGHWPLDTKDKFQKKFPNANIVFLDLPGAGKFYQMTAPKEISQYIDVIRNNSLEHIENGYPNVILGTSLAGVVIAEWSKQYPDDFQRLILASSSFAKVCGIFGRAKVSIVPRMIEILFTKDLEKKEKRILRVNSNSHDKKKNQGRINRFVQIQKQRPMSRRSIINQTLAGKKYRLDGWSDIPTLLLGSKKDKMVTKSCLLKVGNYMNAEVFMHEYSGHGLPIDALDWLVDKTFLWLLK